MLRLLSLIRTQLALMKDLHLLLIGRCLHLRVKANFNRSVPDLIYRISELFTSINYAMWKNRLNKVLIIQDSIDVINALHKSLLDEDLQVLSCKGEQGFVFSLKEQPDVILLDVLLANRKAYQLLSDLKNNWNTKHIPVIVTTSINLQEHWDEAYRLGASGYMVIPEHLPYMASRIQKLGRFEEAIAS